MAINDYVNKDHAVKLKECNTCHQLNTTPWIRKHYQTRESNSCLRLMLLPNPRILLLRKNLLRGLDHLYSLFAILLRFHRDKLAVMSDIEQMYHQVNLKESDQDALRFVWKNTNEEEIEDHKKTVHIFGKTDSPCIANWVIKQTASDQSNEYSVDVINTIHENFYMDDYLECFSSEERAIDTIQKVISILSNDGFRLTKWLSNNKNILKSVLPN